MTKELRYKAAKFGFGKLAAHEIKTLIGPLMNEGVWFDEFIVALDSSPPQMDEVLPAFLKVLKKYDIAVPERGAAVWEILKIHISAIASEDIDPLEGLNKMMSDVYWDYDFQVLTKEFIGDSHGIELLIGLYWAYDDLRDESHRFSCKRKLNIDEIKGEVVKEAKRWINKYHPPKNSNQTLS
jgi:hypothetical protein